MTHLSLLCKLQQDQDHQPCHSGTCDGHGTGQPCGLACECSCHGGIEYRREIFSMGGVIDDVEYGEFIAQVDWPGAEVTVLRADPRILVSHELIETFIGTRGGPVTDQVTYQDGVLRIQASNGHYVYRVGEEIPGRHVHPAEFPD